MTSQVSAQDIERVRPAVDAIARRTPVLSSRTMSERFGGRVVLKAENLQRTGSFKTRGASAKLASLDEETCRSGVICASAGNHGQGLALAARERGVRCEVFMPDEAPNAKVDACRNMGASVRQDGWDSVDECIAAARERADAEGLTFVHPFDDPAIVAGQGSLGLELLEQVPDMGQVVVPLGGGGLLSGTAIAVKSARPDVRVVGVQVAACSPYPESLRSGAPVAAPTALTIADGIAVKRPGDLTLALIREWVDDVVIVDEEETAEAMVLLLERAKLVVEGAGAVGVAALLARNLEPLGDGRATVAVLSGGNIDAGLLAAIARRHESQAGRRLVMLTRLPDRPGALAKMLATVAGRGANIVDVSHVREGLDLHVRETAVELVLETRGKEHAKEVRDALAEAGYEPQILV